MLVGNGDLSLEMCPNRRGAMESFSLTDSQGHFSVLKRATVVILAGRSLVAQWTSARSFNRSRRPPLDAEWDYRGDFIRQAFNTLSGGEKSMTENKKNINTKGLI